MESFGERSMAAAIILLLVASVVAVKAFCVHVHATRGLRNDE